MDKQSVTISSLITLGIVTISMLVPGFFDEQKYYCESRPELGVVNCDSFSKYIADNGKCIRTENTNLICKEGWKEVINDMVLPDDVSNEINGVWGKTYICTENSGCIEKINK